MEYQYAEDDIQITVLHIIKLLYHYLNYQNLIAT